MKKYKIVASDLDGTLLDSNSKVTPENLSAIEELEKKGVHFVLSTGRTLAEIPEVLKKHSSIRYILYSNGAVVYDKKTDKRITQCISNVDVRNIMDVLNSYDTHIVFRQNGKLFADAHLQTEEFFNHYNLCEGHCDVINNYAELIDDFSDACYSADEVEVISVFFSNYDDKAICRNELGKISGLSIVGADKYNLEIINANAGKGKALHALCDMVGVSYLDTISVGDSDNDISITESAGLGIAVSNANELLKEVADEVICSNDEHIAAYLLAHYF